MTESFVGRVSRGGLGCGRRRHGNLPQLAPAQLRRQQPAREILEPHIFVSVIPDRKLLAVRINRAQRVQLRRENPRTMAMAMDFSMLYDERRKLFAIGYDDSSSLVFYIFMGRSF